MSPKTNENTRSPPSRTIAGAVLPPTLMIPPACETSWPTAGPASAVVITWTLMPSSRSSCAVVSVCVWSPLLSFETISTVTGPPAALICSAANSMPFSSGDVVGGVPA